MRIITYSDLHLEFGSGWVFPPAVNGDVMILAGDIVTLRDYEPLDQILRKWKKPVLYVTGNHEYYARRPMNEEDNRFKAWLEDRHPHVKLLLDEEVSIGGVNFFGGTMWTDFNGGDLRAMETARSQMNDYRLIYNPDETSFKPADSIMLHKNFASKLLNWFGKNLSGPRVVISHNGPVINPIPNTRAALSCRRSIPWTWWRSLRDTSRPSGCMATRTNATIRRSAKPGSFQINSDIPATLAVLNARILMRRVCQSR
jgi:predicted MPP superfamily phosphohydrolase